MANNLDDLAEAVDAAYHLGDDDCRYDHPAIAAACRAYLAEYDAEHGPDIDKLRAVYVDASARYDADRTDSYRLFDARDDACRNLVAALDAAGNEVKR